MKATSQYEWLTFDNPVAQDVMMECDQHDKRMFPKTKDDACKDSEYSPITYQAGIEGPDYKDIINTDKSDLIGCFGESFLMKNLPKGTYNVKVTKELGSAAKKAITWNLRTFG